MSSYGWCGECDESYSGSSLKQGLCYSFCNYSLARLLPHLRFGSFSRSLRTSSEQKNLPALFYNKTTSLYATCENSRHSETQKEETCPCQRVRTGYCQWANEEAKDPKTLEAARRLRAH